MNTIISSEPLSNGSHHKQGVAKIFANKLFALLTLCIVFSYPLSALADTGFGGGSGTVEDPYIVITSHQESTR